MGFARSASYLKGIPDELRSRWLAACNAQDRPGRRLIAPHEIVKNL